MVEEKKDVKPEGATPQSDPSSEEKKQDTAVSDDVKTQKSDDVVSNITKALKEERAKRKEEQEKAKQLEAQLRELEASRGGSKEFDHEEEKNIAIQLLNSDDFAKDNLDLIEEKVEQGMDIRSAIASVKADILDRIQKEGVSKEVNPNLNLEKPTSTSGGESANTETQNRTLKDVLAGNTDIDPAQLEAIKRQLPRE